MERPAGPRPARGRGRRPSPGGKRRARRAGRAVERRDVAARRAGRGRGRGRGPQPALVLAGSRSGPSCYGRQYFARASSSRGSTTRHAGRSRAPSAQQAQPHSPPRPHRGEPPLRAAQRRLHRQADADRAATRAGWERGAATRPRAGRADCQRHTTAERRDGEHGLGSRGSCGREREPRNETSYLATSVRRAAAGGRPGKRALGLRRHETSSPPAPGMGRPDAPRRWPGPCPCRGRVRVGSALDGACPDPGPRHTGASCAPGAAPADAHPGFRAGDTGDHASAGVRSADARQRAPDARCAHRGHEARAARCG